jgi:hypothetical protein
VSPFEKRPGGPPFAHQSTRSRSQRRYHTDAVGADGS